MKRALIAFLIGAAVIAGLAFRPQEYRRVKSPDGRHVAIAQCRAYQSSVPGFPGQSGDKRGWIVIFTEDGKKIGEADVGMVSKISDIRWTSDSVEIRLGRVFKIDGTSLRRRNRSCRMNPARRWELPEPVWKGLKKLSVRG